VLLAAGAVGAAPPQDGSPGPGGCAYVSTAYRPVLVHGSTGAVVRQAQCLSNVWGGVPKLAVNGVFDDATLVKVRWIQGCHGLPRNGVVDAATWHVLYRPALDCYDPYPV
jgi:hypothetical protein